MPCWRKAETLIFLAAALLAGGCHASKPSDNVLAPDFELRDMQGKAVHLSQFRGHPVLLDFWATWCGPCIFSIPATEKLYETEKSKGLIVLGLNMDDDPADVPAFVRRMKMTYPVLYAARSTVPGRYALEGLPLFIVIDAQGRAVRRYDGVSPAAIDDMDGLLMQMLSAAQS